MPAQKGARLRRRRESFSPRCCLKQIKSYDEAVAMLTKLAQLAEFRGSKDDYRRRVNDLCERYKRLSGFKGRVQQAKLLE